MEVYVDNMFGKSKLVIIHIMHLKESFDIVKKYKIKLNPKKCVFGVASSKFVGFMDS